MESLVGLCYAAVFAGSAFFLNRFRRVTLGDKMKSLERETHVHGPFLIRLDGHAFSKFTSSLRQPFDSAFNAAMILTTRDLLTRFNATLAYTQSDEITLCFLGEPLQFNGRVQKISTLAAGLASVRFNHHLKQLLEDPRQVEGVVLYEGKEVPLCDAPPFEDHDAKRERLFADLAHFDARLFECSIEEMVENLRWRQKDGWRNFVSKCAQHVEGAKRTMYKHTGQKMEMIPAEMLNAISPAIQHGCLLKRQRYVKRGAEGHPDALRTRVVFFVELMKRNEAEKWKEMITNKYYEE